MRPEFVGDLSDSVVVNLMSNKIRQKMGHRFTQIDAGTRPGEDALGINFMFNVLLAKTKKRFSFLISVFCVNLRLTPLIPDV